MENLKTNHKFSEFQYELEKENSKASESELLKSEIDYYRAELDHITKQNIQALISLKHSQEQQLSKLFADKEFDLSSEFSKILSLQKTLSKESDENSSLRQKILSKKLEHSEKLSEIHSEIEKLIKDAEYLRFECIKTCKNEVVEYQNQIEIKRLDHNKLLRNTENLKHEELYELENDVENEENKVKILQFEVEGLRARVLEKDKFNQSELEKIHSTLRSTQRIAEQQEADLKIFRDERDKERKNNRDNEKNLVIARHKLSVLKAENEELKSQMKRLENLTYGV